MVPCKAMVGDAEKCFEDQQKSIGSDPYGSPFGNPLPSLFCYFSPQPTASEFTAGVITPARWTTRCARGSGNPIENFVQKSYTVLRGIRHRNVAQKFDGKA